MILNLLDGCRLLYGLVSHWLAIRIRVSGLLSLHLPVRHSGSSWVSHRLVYPVRFIETLVSWRLARSVIRREGSTVADYSSLRLSLGSCDRLGIWLRWRESGGHLRAQLPI